MMQLFQTGLNLVYIYSLASQTHFHKKGKGLVNCVCKLRPTTLYSADQSCCSLILSHDALCPRLSSNSGLENSKRELRHLSTSATVKKTSLLRERAIWLHNPLIAFWWVRLSLAWPDPTRKGLATRARLGQVCETTCTTYLYHWHLYGL